MTDDDIIQELRANRQSGALALADLLKQLTAQRQLHPDIGDNYTSASG